MSTAKQSTQNGQVSDDTGLGETIVSSQLELPSSSPEGNTEQGQPDEAVASTDSRASTTLTTLPNIVSTLQNIAEIVPIEDQLRGARPRTLTVKGQEFNSELKKKIALAKDKEFRSKLVSFEELVYLCRDPVKIKQETSMMATYADSVIQAFYNWIEVLQDTIQIQHASNRQGYLIDSWKTVHATALDQIQRLQEEETRTVYSQRSHRSRSSTKSGSSTSSRRDTLIDCQVKRAALQEKLKFTSVIADQEKMLEQLKLQQELGAVIAPKGSK